MRKILTLFFLLEILLVNLHFSKFTTIKKSLDKLIVVSNDIIFKLFNEIKISITKNNLLYFIKNHNNTFDKLIFNVHQIQPANGTNNFLIKKMNALEKEMIIYKATQEKNVITVFTDITCDYCHELHKHIKDYNALGITVRYLAFPHINIRNQSEKDMKAIWCAKNRNKAFDEAMNGKNIQPSFCNINIVNHYELGTQFCIIGTPTIVLSNGYIIPGYRNPKEMKELLDIHQK